MSGISVQQSQPVTTVTQLPTVKEQTQLPPQNTPSLSQDILDIQTHQGTIAEPLNFDNLPEPKKKPWKVSFGFSHSFTQYFNTDMKLESSRVNVGIKDFEFVERGSRGFYNPANWEQPMDALRWLDEPTNTFSLAFQKDKNEIYLSAFHPKFLFNPDQVKHIQGTVDGVAVNHVDYLNKPFDGYNQTPGELEIARFENTHQQMEYEVGYGRQLTLLDKPKFGKLIYTPGLSAGVMMGGNYSSMIKEGEWWEFESNKDALKVQGAGGSVRNKIAWEAPNGRVSVFGENKTSLYKLEHGFMDGKANYNLAYTSTAVGVSVKLFGNSKETPKNP